MKSILLMVPLLVSVCLSDVMPGTSYYNDCVEFDNLIEDGGIYNADTKIMYKNGDYHYVAYFSESYDLDSDWLEVFLVATAAGFVSRNTSWASSGCVCVYYDEVVAILTEDCRTLVRAYELGYSEDQLLNYYLNTSYALDREDTNW